MIKQKYKLVSLSDIHLGSKGSKAKNVLSFLKNIETEILILDGDIFDFWAMKSKIYWNSDCTSLIRKILKLIKNGTKVVYIVGNHDDAIRNFIPFTFGNEIEFLDEYVYTSISGKKLLFIHGDIFDFAARWLSIIGSHIYDWLLRSNNILHKIRLLLGYKRYWSLSAYLKSKTKKALSSIKNFEEAAMLYAKKKECDGVVCGHIHSAALYTKNDMLYINCGDWVESLTCCVEHLDGSFEIIYWHDILE